MHSFDPHPHLTLFFGVWAAIGPLAGILIGHYLTRSWQQEEWLLDKRREEYRELLRAITGAYMAVVHIDELRGKGRAVPPDLDLESERAQIDSFRTMRDRILIAEEIEFSNTLAEWDMALTNFKDNNDIKNFALRFSSINETLVQMARIPVAKPHLGLRLLNGLALWKARYKSVGSVPSKRR